MTDPIADMLTRIRNSLVAKQDSTAMPASNLKVEVARVLKEQGFIKDFEIVKDGERRSLKIWMRYAGKREAVITGLKRVSKPGLRVYCRAADMPRVLGGLGIAIVTTPKGVMTARAARQQNLGGEVLCYVW
jgi:small subunit ribosomal protein S8